MFLDVARITIEALSPVSVASGEADLQHDVVVMRDVFGLPAIPGSALAGVLRSALGHDHPQVDWLFGIAREKDKKQADDPVSIRQKSRLGVSWAVVLDSKGNPVDGPVDGVTPDFQQDDILRLLSDTQPIKRDHVKITERGVAEDQAKFDRGAVPAGTRFHFELTIEREGEENSSLLEELIRIIARGLKVGGATRKGYGNVGLVVAKWTTLDLCNREHVEALAQLRGRLAKPLPATLEWKALNNPEKTNQDGFFSLKLEMTDFWRSGEGATVVGNYDNSARERKKLPDSMTYQESYIDWEKTDAPKVSQRVVLPASSIKGPVRHRTLFHLRRFDQRAARPLSQEIDLEPLFGAAKEGNSSSGKGSAGRVFFNDCVVETKRMKTKILDHNGIDRFTGGVLAGVLFSEEVLYKPTLNVQGTICDIADIKEKSPDLLVAFKMALADLTEGRLALGAASAKGHGYAHGEFTHMDEMFPEEVPV